MWGEEKEGGARIKKVGRGKERRGEERVGWGEESVLSGIVIIHKSASV